MIRYVPYDEIDKKKWDDCIKHAINGLPYGYSWFLDTVSEYWDGLVMGDYEAVFPLTWNEKFGIKYLYQPYFCQQLGVFSRSKDPEYLLKDFLKEIPDEFKFVEINTNAGREAKGFKYSNRITHHLNLNRSINEIRAGYSENVKRSLKKAEENSLYTSDYIKPEDLVELFKNNLGEKVKMSERQYAKGLRLMYECIHKGLGILVGVYDDANQLSGGCFFIRSHHKLIYLFPASDRASRKKGTMQFLMDTMFEQYANSRMLFDFEGSMIPSISRFYQSFGAKQVSYFRVMRNNLPWWAKLAKKLTTR
jgi:hypothetical protein